MSTIKVDTVQSSSGGAVTLTNLSPPKAFLTFDGSTPQIDKSANISGFTDRGTGAYTASYTNSFSDADYSIVFGFGGNLVSTSAQQFPVVFTGSEATGSLDFDSRQCDNDAASFAQADHNRISLTMIS